MDKTSLTFTAGRFRASERRTKILRGELAAAIRQAHAEKMSQKDICEATGYTRQQVRRIVIATEDDPADDGYE